MLEARWGRWRYNRGALGRNTFGRSALAQGFEAEALQLQRALGQKRLEKKGLWAELRWSRSRLWQIAQEPISIQQQSAVAAERCLRIGAGGCSRLKNFAEKPEPCARQDACLRKAWSAPCVLRCAPEKITELAASVEMNPWCVLLMLDAVSSKPTYRY